MQNHKKFQNSCEESSNVCVHNHQDNYFLINVACKSDTNMLKWPHACCNFRQFRVVVDDFKLFCDISIMLWDVSDPNLGGGGLIAFILDEQLTHVIHEIPLFPDPMTYCHSIGIGIKGTLK